MLHELFLYFEELKKQLETSKKKNNDLIKINQVGPGRRKVSVSLGRVQPNFVKQILEALVQSSYFEKSITQKINEIHKSLAWDDIREVEDGFKKIAFIITSEV